MKINNRNTFIYFYLVHSIIKSSLLKIEGYVWNEKIKNFVRSSEETLISEQANLMWRGWSKIP